jgi:hypothetical protein
MLDNKLSHTVSHKASISSKMSFNISPCTTKLSYLLQPRLLYLLLLLFGYFELFNVKSPDFNCVNFVLVLVGRLVLILDFVLCSRQSLFQLRILRFHLLWHQVIHRFQEWQQWLSSPEKHVTLRFYHRRCRICKLLETLGQFVRTWRATSLLMMVSERKYGAL